MEVDSLRYRKLTDNGDYTFGRGEQNFITNAEAVAQAIKTRLALLKNEWWENTSDGLPLFQNILGVRGTQENKKSADLLIQERIAETTGVKGIKNFESIIDGKTRRYTLSCVVETVYGDTSVGEVF